MRRRRQKQPLQQRRGFVLLLVVMLLAICCLIFTQIALKSHSKVNQFVTGQRELADYWAVISMRRTVMPNANRIWMKSVEQRTEPTLRIDFGSGAYLLKLENESSKLNLVRAWRDFPVQAARETIGSELMMFDGQAQRRFEELDGRVGSWRQLSTVLDQSILDRTDQVTLWGSGRIDITQASDEVVEKAWKGLYGTLPPADLYHARQVWPPPPWSDLRLQLGLRESQLELADKWFSTSSTSFSLEVLSLSSPHKTTGVLFVSDGSTNHAFAF